MVEIDYSDAFDVVSEDAPQMIELVCENWTKDVEEYIGMDKLKKAFMIVNEYFDFIPEDEKEEVHNKLTELGY